MVGEGVLHESLQHNDVEQVLVVGRRSCGYNHPKLKEIIHGNLYDLSSIEDQLKGYDACFFCLGMSSVGVKEPEFTKVTYELTMHFATTLSKLNPGMTFCYVSGSGTNENGKLMWQRVKGKTESDLMKLPFSKVHAFRPGFIKPMKGLTRTHAFYKYINWMFPIGRALYPAGFCTLEELAQAMINITKLDYTKKVIEGKDIIKLAAVG